MANKKKHDFESCLDCNGTGLNPKDTDMFCKTCIGGSGKKQHAWRLFQAKKIVNSPTAERVTFVFKDDDTKARFMGQLSDGFGEDYCALTFLDDCVVAELFENY